MKSTLKRVLGVIFLCTVLTSTSTSSEIVHEFKNPAFSGNGYSSHVLSVEQLQANRKKGLADDAKSAAAAAARSRQSALGAMRGGVGRNGGGGYGGDPGGGAAG